MIKKFLTLFLSTLFILSGCAFHKKSHLHQDKTKTLKSKMYKAKQTIIFKAVRSALQEKGYLISVSSINRGLIIAKLVSCDSKFSKIFQNTPYHDEKSITVYIEEVKKGESKVCINCSQSTQNRFGEAKDVSSVSDPLFYKELFEFIDTNILLRT